LVFDNSPLSHFARAGELAALEVLTHAYDRVVTQAVLDEFARGGIEHAGLRDIQELDWLREVRVDGLAELQVFAVYAARLGSGARDIGEASTLAWAEVHEAVAVVDERAGTRHARERGLEVHGTLWLIAQGYQTDVSAARAASSLSMRCSTRRRGFPAAARVSSSGPTARASG
jgi:predicted nucleic acid-binding protein